MMSLKKSLGWLLARQVLYPCNIQPQRKKNFEWTITDSIAQISKQTINNIYKRVFANRRKTIEVEFNFTSRSSNNTETTEKIRAY